MSAMEASNGFGFLLGTVRAEPATIEKRRRPMVVILSVKAYQRLTARRARKAPVVLPAEPSEN